MRAIGLLIFLILITSIVNAQWERTAGPEGGQITMLETINDTIYLGTKVKGVYFSIDDGVNWTALNSGIEHFEVTSMTSNDTHLFVGTGENGVYRSINGGQAWLAPSSPGNALSISSLVVKDQFLFAGSYIEGVFRSSDNGDTWEESLPGFLNSILAMCVIENTIYASSYGITFATDDNGDSWYEVDQLATGFIWSFYTSDDLIIAGATNRIFRSYDQGITFEIINIPFEFPVVDILSISNINDTLYIGTSFYGVYQSTDDGSTWTQSNIGMGPKEVKSLTTTSSSTLLAGVRSAGVFRSENSGNSWSKSNAGLVAGSTNLSLLSYQDYIYAGTVDDGVFKSEDDGETWIKLVSDMDTIHYGDVRGLCAKDGAIYASTRYHTSYSIYKYLFNDEIWMRSSHGLPLDLGKISDLETSGNNILAATSAGLYYTVDDGANWQLTDLPANEVETVAAAGNGIVYATVGGAIFKSTNDGQNWVLNKLTGLEILDISAKDNFAWAGTRFSGALYTNDYGGSWTTCSGFPTGAGVFAIEPVSDGMVLAAPSIAPWLYASFDDGASFESYGEGVVPIMPVESIAVNEKFMFAGTNYSGVWKRENPFYVDIHESTVEHKKPTLSQNYPNPFRLKTTIPYEIIEDAKVVLEVFTHTGLKLLTLVNEFKKSGQHVVDFNNQSLPAGFYYYRLSVGNSTETRKMMIVY